MIVFREIAAFVRRDRLVESTYRANVLLALLGELASMLTVYFLGLAIGPEAFAKYGGSYFAFALLGLCAAGPMYTALTGMASRVREAQLTGTLESVLVTPIAPWRAIAWSAVFPMGFVLGRSLVVFAVGAALLDVPLHASGVPIAVVALVLALLAYAALGLLSSAFTIVLKRGDPVAMLIERASVLFGGVLFPVAVLPGPLRLVADVLPLTHGLDAIRGALLDGQGWADVAPSLGALGLFVVVVGPAAALALRLALDRARRDGTLAHF